MHNRANMGDIIFIVEINMVFTLLCTLYCCVTYSRGFPRLCKTPSLRRVNDTFNFVLSIHIIKKRVDADVLITPVSAVR